MASSSIVNSVLLRDEKLRQLAQLIRNHEVNNLYYITFKSPGEQLQYLRICNDNVSSVNTILDNCKAVANKYSSDSVRGPITDQILAYVEHCINNSLQIIRNYTLRKDYLEKMMDHHQHLYRALDELDTTSDDAVEDFTDSVEELDRLVMNNMRLSLNSHASAEYSRYLRNTGIGFSNLVQSYQTKLGYTGQFEELEEEQKLEVYASIMEASGRLSVLEPKSTTPKKGSSSSITKKGSYNTLITSNSITLISVLEPKTTIGGLINKANSYISPGQKKAIKKFGSSGMLIKDIGQIVWDTYSSDHPITTATREALILAAKTGGTELGELVGVAAAAELLGEAATAVFLTGIGLLTGFVGGFILGAAAGILFDLIFSSGGQKPLPTDGLILYVAPMPNGHDLAKQIAYN